MNIMAQILGVLSLVLMFFSYQKKSKRDFLYLQIFMNVFFGLQYLVLNAFSALASNIVSIIKSTIFYKFEKQNKDIHIGFLIVFEMVIISLGILTYNGWYSIIPICIAALYTYGTWQKKLSNTYKIGIVAATFWIYYNFVVGAYASVIGSVIELIASIIGVIRLKNGKKKKFLKVMFGIDSFANGTEFQYKIGEVNVADNWNPNSEEPKETGGFNFSIEDKILRWLVRGDTIYDVIIPEDAEVMEVDSESAPHGVFRANKIIIRNPRKITDKLAMRLYQKSNLPEKSYFKALAGCAVRGHIKTTEKIIKDKVNKKNIDLVISEINDFVNPDKAAPKGDDTCYKHMWELLNKIKEQK